MVKTIIFLFSVLFAFASRLSGRLGAIPRLSWCQPTFPASGTRYPLVRGKPLVLRFRLFIHSGKAPDKALANLLWDTFNSEIALHPTFTFIKLNYGNK